MDALPHHGGHGWPRSPTHHDQDHQGSEEGAGGSEGGGTEDGGRGRAVLDVVEMDHHEGLHGGGGGHAPPPEGDAFEAERQRLRTEDRSSFGGRPHSTVDMHDADAARSQGAFLLGSSAPVHLTYHRNSYEAVGLLDHHQQHHGGQPLRQAFFAPYATTTSTQPSLHSHPLLLHQSLPPPHHFPMAAYHHQGLAAESGLDPHGHMPDDYAAAQFTPELEGAGEESPDVTESSRQFLLRLAHKTGTDEGEVLPFIVKLEREWLIQKEQLRCLDEETFVARLGFPASLAQSIREELSAGSTQVPNMLKYKVDQRQQSQHPQHHQSQHTPQPTQVAVPPPQLPQKEGGGGSSAGGSGGKEAATGRKRKRLTLAEWVSKVEQFSLDTNHDPSPFRVASIYQVECYCCGYAVNMNKPGQLYYLKRHVEGVRPDVRLSNHFKNYKRWRQQYHPGEPVDLTPEKLMPAKRLKPGDDNDEGEDEVEGEKVLDYTTDEGIRRIRSHSPSQGRRADRDTPPPVPGQPRSALSKSLGASGEGEIEVEGEGSIQLRALDFVAPLRHSGSGPLHGVPQLPEHMMPAPFSTQLHPIPPTPSHLTQPQAAVSLGHHLQFSQHHHYHLPPQPTFSAPLGHLQSYPSPPQQSQQLVDQYAATFAYGLSHPPQQQLQPQYPPVTHLRSFPPGAQHNERHS